LITPDEITAGVIDAIENEKLSVRLPRRMAFSSYLADAPRALTKTLTRDIRRKVREGRM